MTGKFSPIPLKQQLKLILRELSDKGIVFGIPRELFFIPAKNTALCTDIFGHRLQSPVGVAAGPHTQMAQNIVAAWLTGARYIELKTIQTLDELEVPKPCIDMQDEGYNCEWSQELKIRESFSEYLDAWIIIHILNHRLGWGNDPGVVFNMSIGYDLKGIMQENVQWFLDMMNDCGEYLDARLEEIMDICPELAELDIPRRVSDNITLSTMHGCPPDEIEAIASYLISERKLHTFVKVNPTLLGQESLREILNNKLGFRTCVPDEAFAHDLKYDDALVMIRSLRTLATEKGVGFGLKLTNTLESENNKTVFGSDVSMMYMSGRALHPISVNLAARLQEEFDGELLLSFSAGADAFNITGLISCGFRTVTVCSDLLRPGGYMRLGQYFTELRAGLQKADAKSITDLAAAAPANLKTYSQAVISSPSYRREYIRPPDIKSDRELGMFDCIASPCRDNCATRQDIPEYLWHTSQGEYDKAFAVILRTNPFPSVTGMICDHLCQNKCTRINYDDPLQIREVKRFISESGRISLRPAPENGKKAAIIGAGPAGLSCAFYLRMAGFSVDLFEARPEAGGMVRYAIPGFRLTDEAVQKDIERITDLGVNVRFESRIDKQKFRELQNDYPYIFLGPGAQLASPLNIEGADAPGVLDPLQFLFAARAGTATGTGRNVVIIGGGNTAMDAARTAYRLVGRDGTVTVVYRRTVNEMPADEGEIREVLKERISILELTAPEKIIVRDGAVAGLTCSRMELKGTDHSGRPAPVKIEGSEFVLPCDTVIPAIGQMTDIDIGDAADLSVGDNPYRTRIKGVYTGGDAMRGASTAINAIADGRNAAEQIIRDAGLSLTVLRPDLQRGLSYEELMIKRATRIHARPPAEPTDDERRSFALVSTTQDSRTMQEEAARCIWCDEICSICTTVCPNLANRTFRINPVCRILQKAVKTDDDKIVFEEDSLFDIRQQYQILHLANFCNECGNCNTFCPTSGAPFREKPRFWLTTESFNNAEEGFFLSVLNDRKNLIYKHKGNFATLTQLSDSYIYETDFVMATLDRETFRLTDVKFLTPCIREAHFQKAAEMAVLMQGADSLLNV
ncbi:MAG: putative selenate reductase subunit YgfK [Bacteroidales bacterium]|jgi:putative selenate reductase|nr:putative selenate reductase subunit YgfK [Bacteroidales bacterium]